MPKEGGGRQSEIIIVVFKGSGEEGKRESIITKLFLD